MLQQSEVVFAFLLAIIALLAFFQIQQSSPQQQPPSRMTEPSSPEATPPPSPILNSISTPYSEAEIVSLITDLYSLLTKLAYFSPDQITWPSSEEHTINEALCEQLHLDPAVISLMKKLPYLNQDLRYSIHLFPGSMPYSFLDDDEILESRDPETPPPRKGKNNLRLDYLLPHDIALSHNLRDGMTLVLDTKDNTVRKIESEDSPEDQNPEGTELERPDDPMHYRNWYTQHAPSYLRRLNERIRSLELIPSGSEQFGREYHGSEDAKVRDEAKKILIERYGWPDNFRQEDWSRDVEEVWNDVIKRSIH